MMTIEDIINSCANRGEKKGNKNTKKANKTVSNDLRKFHEEESALDKIMSDVQDSINQDGYDDSDEDEPDVIENELNDIDDDVDSGEDEENDDYVDVINDYTSGSKYYISDKLRLCIYDEYVGTQTFSIFRTGEDMISIDDDALGVLSTLICLKIESTGTPFVICRKKDMLVALKEAGIESFNLQKFFIIDPLKGFDEDDNHYIYAYYSEAHLDEWNHIIDFLVDKEMSNEAIMDILSDILKTVSNRTFMSIITDDEYSHIVNSGDLNVVDDIVDIISNDSDTKFDSDISCDDIEDLFISSNFFEKEMKYILNNVDEEAGVEHDQNPFQGEQNGSDGHGISNPESEETRVQKEEETEEEEKEQKEEETEENEQGLDNDALEREIKEGFEEISEGIS